VVRAAPQVLTRDAAATRARDLVDLGRALFNDRTLSASGRLACATCHNPARAFASPRGAPVEYGGADGRQPGHRAVPSLMYLQTAPPFTEHFVDSENGGADNGPTGGLTWDGRVDRLRDQAKLPLFSPYEMANATPADLMVRVHRSHEAAPLVRLFGAPVLTDPARCLDSVGASLEAYEHYAGTFAPYSSKYDAYLAGRATLSPTEARGLRAFEDPARGDCARCHISRPDPKGQPPLFTDFGFAALGLPRNPAIPANLDPAYYDLGLCGPDRHDLASHPEYCGLFLTPTLRDVATRRVFFHNGVAGDLARAVAFYGERDVHPDRWYPTSADGAVEMFNDLPPAYRRNLERNPPFGGRPGAPPRLSPGDVADIAAFLRTLTDGFIAAPPALLAPPPVR
jgi:cytochrome c peroxidase